MKLHIVQYYISIGDTNRAKETLQEAKESIKIIDQESKIASVVGSFSEIFTEYFCNCLPKIGFHLATYGSEAGCI